MQSELTKTRIKWNRIMANNPIGKTMEALIIKETQAGLLLNAGRAGVGILKQFRISKASKYLGIELPDRGYITVMVVNHDKDRMQLEFSIPDIEHKEESLRKIDPKNNEFKVMTRCRVRAHNRNGFYTVLESGIDGFLPLDEVPVTDKNLKTEQVLYVDDIIDALVIRVDYDEELAILSIRELWKADKNKIRSDVSYRFHPPQIKKEIAVKSYKDYEYGKKRCVLILEDEEEEANITREFLYRQGHDVFITHNLNETIELLPQHKFDCIVSDFMFKNYELDGLDICKQINENHLKIPFVFFSAYIDEMNVARIMNSKTPVLGILVKFAEINTLGKIVATLREHKTKHPSGEFTETNLNIQDMDQKFYAKCYNKAQSISTGIKMAVFRHDPMSKDYTLSFYSKGINSDDYRLLAYDIKYSPIKDVILSDSHTYVPNVVEETGFEKIRNEKKGRVFTDFNCFIGFPLQIMNEKEYGLFFFHEREHEFDNDIELRLMRLAHELAMNMEQVRLTEKIVDERQINQITNLLPAMIHELSKNISEHKMISDRISKLFRMSSIETTEQRNQIISSLLDFFDEQANDLIDVFDGYLLNIRPGTTDYRTSLLRLLDNITKSLKYTASETYGVLLSLEHIDSQLNQITSESQRFYHILMNILLNAFYHTQEIHKNGSGKVSIYAYYETNERVYPVKIRVKDNGIGIHYDDLNRIFQPRYSTKPQGEGSGLGLYIAKRCIEEMGGRLSVEETSMYSGTTFLIELPEIRTHKV